MEHQLAIAIRQQLSEDVSDALVDTGDESVIRTLLSNRNAKISKTTLEYLVEESRRVDSFQEPILGRHDLDIKLVERMYLWVSAALRQSILEDWNLDPATVDALLEDATGIQVKSTIRSLANKSKADELAGNIVDDQIISANMLLKTLQDGEITLFIAMLRRMTGLRTVLVTDANLPGPPVGSAGLEHILANYGLQNVIQVGPDNQILSSFSGFNGILTVIQNTLDNTVIQHISTITINISRTNPAPHQIQNLNLSLGF